MSENLKNEKLITEYLLGDISDEQTILEIEEQILTNENYLKEVELIEDGLIDDYVNKNLSPKQNEKFETFFLKNISRREKLSHTLALKEFAKKSEKATGSEKENKKIKTNKYGFFFSPQLAFGLVFLILFTAASLWFFIFSGNGKIDDSLAELQTIYKTERPVQGRIIDFEYAKPPELLRGGKNEDFQQLKRRKIENNLIEAAESDPNAENYNALGVFYLTGRDFQKAVKFFETAGNLSPSNAEIRNNLGLAFYEKSLQQKNEDKLLLLSKALTETEKALQIESKNLEALFNKALILQEANSQDQAIKVWQEYLKKDNDSEWADEAKNNLENLQKEKNTSFKTKEKILQDFIKSVENNNKSLAWTIHSQTKELNAQKLLSVQLTKNYLENFSRGDPQEAEKFLEALYFIGRLEKSKNADNFFYDLAEFYARAAYEEKNNLLNAHNILSEALSEMSTGKYETAEQKLVQSQKIFTNENDELNAYMLDVPLAFCLTRLGKLDESNEKLQRAEKFARSKKYKWLLSTVLDWTASNQSIAKEVSKSIETAKETLKISEETGNTYEKQRISGGLSQIYYEIGETNNSLKTISRSMFSPNLYNQSEKQAWRNYKHVSELLAYLGEFDLALAYGNEYVKLAREEIKYDPSLLQYSHVLIGKIYFDKKDYNQALRHAEKSREIGKNLIQDFQQKLYIAMAQILQGHVERETDQCEKAVKRYDLAIEKFTELSSFVSDKFLAQKGKLLCYRKTGKKNLFESQLNELLNAIEKDRSEISEEEYRNIFFDSEHTIYDLAIEEALNENNPERAFQYSENSKARSLLDFVQDGAIVSGEEIKYQKVTKPLNLTEIQNRMPENVQLVQFAVLPDKLIAWLITKNEFKTKETKVANRLLEKKISEYLKLLKSKNDIENLIIKSSELYKFLIEPIYSELDKDKELFFIADKSLHRLPFASLYDKKSGKYFIEDFTIANTPSSTIFILTTEDAEKKQKQNESLLSVGNPSFNTAENSKLKNLNSAGREASEIAEIYKDSDLLLENQATKNKFLSKFGQVNTIHFAGHYVANEKSPFNSKLILAEDFKNQTGDDLRVLDIAGKDGSHLKLVVLSACQTDVEHYFKGEGSIGAARIFLAIGSPIVVASYFEVESDSTANLMINFHRYRKNKNFNIPRALRQSQLDAIASNDKLRQSPFYWSAFSPTGGFTEY